MAKRLDLVISMQPGFTYQWNDLFCQVLGQDRGDKMDPFNRVIAAGLVVCAGSDCPVTEISPLIDIAHCANGAQPIRRTRMTDALKMHTIWGAYAIGMEKTKGSIEVGKDGDFTIIDRDPYLYEASPELFDMKVLMTINKGKTIYTNGLIQ
jgi:predicted amidohydrolase YtcJ